MIQNVRLDEVCIPKSSNLAQKDILQNVGEYPVYGASGFIRNINFFHQESEYIAVVKDGAGIGRTMLLPAKSSIIGTMQYLIPKNNIDTKYLYYAVKSMNLSRYFSGATIPHIYFKDYKKELVPLYSKDKQKLISSSLDKLEDIITKKKQQLTEYDQLIKSRFVEMFGDPTQNSGSWDSDYLGNLLTIVRGASPRPIQSFITEEENGINWIKIGDTLKDSMFITSTKEKIKPEGVAKSRFVKEGDFLLSNSMSFGRPYILKTSGCVHDGWLVLSNYETSFNRYFLYSLLNSEAVYNQFKSIVVGGVVNNLNSEMVRNLKVIIPPMDMQIKFSEILEQVDKLKFVVQQSLDETQELFDSLMQKYFG